MSVIYVVLDVYYVEERAESGEGPVEEKITKGPYARLFRGYEGEIHGMTPGGEDEHVFSATVGCGGYCDSCAYEYPDFGVDMPTPVFKAEVKHFEIVVREE